MKSEKIKIAIIEDEILVAYDIAEKLKSFGYDVPVTGLSGEEAIKIVQEHQPDLVLMDIILNGEMTGIEAAQYIKDHYNTGIVYLTAHTDKNTLEKAKLTEPLAYLVKPFEERELHATIEMALYKSKMESKLRESEKRYREFFENDLTGDFIALKDGTIIDCNLAFVQIFGFSNKEQALEHNLCELFPDENDFKKYLQKLEQNDSFIMYEHDLFTIDKKPVSVIENVLATFDAMGTLQSLRGYIFNITDRKKLQEQIIQTQKMESINTLASGIAHDFNNILCSIVGRIALIKMNLPEKHPIFQHIDVIENNATHGTQLVEQLVTFARGEKLEAMPVNLNNIIEKALQIIKPTFPKNIEINNIFDNSLPNILGDANQLQQIIINLCINARDAMNGKGKLYIETGFKMLSAEDLSTYPKATPGGYAILSIRDTGEGINPQILNNIFEPFFTTKEGGKGSGLGLSVVYSIVKNHDGFIEVQSTLNQGTIFTIFLPMLIENKISKPYQGNNEFILLVDDDEIIRNMASEILTKGGYQIITADNGEEALKIYKSKMDKIKLVIMDLLMPKLGGYGTFMKLQALNPDIKVILSSGILQSVKEAEISKSGVKGFIHKPYKYNELLTKVKRCLNDDDIDDD